MGLVTDMCRAIEVNIAPALDDIMNTLVQSLQASTSFFSYQLKYATGSMFKKMFGNIQ